MINGLLSRRRLLQWMAASGIGALARPVKASGREVLRRMIPSSGEDLAAIGMGTWQTFDVGSLFNQRATRCEVLKTFFSMGGELIDSSPMYGRAETVLGDCLEELEEGRTRLFAATKVWTWGKRQGVEQMERSRQLWGVPRFDLMQIHNLLDWQTHLPVLREMKAAGAIRYIGVTTSHGRRHEELERILLEEEIDVVQFTYNLMDRQAEQRLLPLAAERGVAVIINRPFRGGTLFDRVQGKPLPSWAAQFGIRHWSQFFLKFIVSHPAVTCAIPATSNPQHMRENMGALHGSLPDQATRKRMVRVFETI